MYTADEEPGSSVRWLRRIAVGLVVVVLACTLMLWVVLPDSKCIKVRQTLESIHVRGNVLAAAPPAVGVNSYDDDVTDEDIIQIQEMVCRRLTETFGRDPDVFHSLDHLGWPRLNWFWRADNGYAKLCVGQANDNNYLSLKIAREQFEEDMMFTKDTEHTPHSGQGVASVLDRNGMVNVWEHPRN